VERMQVAY